MLLDPGTGGPIRTKGLPTRIQIAAVVAVHTDGTIDARLLTSRAVKANVEVPRWWAPQVGERCLLADVDGDKQRPICLGYFAPADGGLTPPTTRFVTSLADASDTTKGVTKLSVAPVAPTSPIAVGDNDTRMTNARTPTGAAGGSLAGTYPNPILAGATVTSLPGSPVDGQVIHFVADATHGVVWTLKYDLASGKWRAVGAPAPLFDEVVASETTASTTYTTLTTAGPSVALPLAGDYMVEVGAEAFGSSTAASTLMSYQIGATAASDNDWYRVASAQAVTGSRPRRKTGLAAVTLAARYRVSGAITGTWANRWMRVTPIQF